MSSEKRHQRRIPRRALLKCASAGALAAFAPSLLAHASAAKQRWLSFYNLHTGEQLKTVYWVKGRYVSSELDEINYLLRDFRTDNIEPIDPELLDLLYALRRRMDSKAPFHIISGYRSPKTNAMLRQRSRSVAKRSYHTRGMAVDVRLPGRELNHLRRAALALKRGGVGYYPASDFIHVDTGPVRFW